MSSRSCRESSRGKTRFPILSNILLQAADGHLSFTSTDLDLTLLSQAEAKVSRPGSVTVPARKLFDLIRNLPEADVALKLMDNHYLGVTCERSNFRLVAQPAEDFPTVPKVEAKKGVSFPLDLWKRLTRKVLYAVSAEETRFQLMGALLKDKGKEFELVATDGHRLALIDFPKEDAKATLPNVLIPKKALAEILKMDGGDGRAARDPALREPPALHRRQPPADRAAARRELSRLREDPVEVQRSRGDRPDRRSARRPSGASRSFPRSARAASSSPSRRDS